MIVSVSRRSDIPACHGAWFLEQVRAGECVVRNPVNRAQFARVGLKPSEVDAFVFWSKNPAPFFPILAELDAKGYRYYFLFTLNDYPPALEPGMPPVSARVKTFLALATRLGPDRVVWRYDPIILSKRLTPEWHLATFARLASDLRGACDTVIVSFMDWYSRVNESMAQAEAATGDKFLRSEADISSHGRFALELARLAATAGMRIQSCCEPPRLAEFGIPAGSCIDARRINRLWGLTVATHKDKGQRKFCLCAESRDIGEYGTCRHGCAYCYAVKKTLPSHAAERHPK